MGKLLVKNASRHERVPWLGGFHNEVISDLGFASADVVFDWSVIDAFLFECASSCRELECLIV